MGFDERIGERIIYGTVLYFARQESQEAEVESVYSALRGRHDVWGPTSLVPLRGDPQFQRK